MSTDLRTALRDAVSSPPSYDPDVAAIVGAGTRRTRRRARVAVAACAAVVVALAVTAGVVSSPRPDPDPQPAKVVRLDLGGAESVRLDVMATTRGATDGPGDGPLDRATFEAITDDGLVLVNRHRNASRPLELGLLDPSSGATEWLPPPGADNRELQVVDLTSERLVVVARLGGGYGYVMLVFDRESRTWQRSEVRLPGGVEVHVGPQLVLSPDDRLYLGSTSEGVPNPVRWWSAPLTGESPDLRAEPELEGASVAWGDDVMVSAFPTGRVVVSGQDQERVVSEHRPAGCAPPEDFPDWPVGLLVSGDTPVVTYWCRAGGSNGFPHTVIYQDDGQKAVEVLASARAADHDHVVLTSGLPPSLSPRSATPEDEGTFVVDLDRLTASRIGDPPTEAPLAVEDGLVLWTSEEPSGDGRHTRPVWSVARID
jgi:hypothetical protein